MYIIMIGCDEYLWRCGGIPSMRCHFFCLFLLIFAIFLKPPAHIQMIISPEQ